MKQKSIKAIITAFIFVFLLSLGTGYLLIKVNDKYLTQDKEVETENTKLDKKDSAILEPTENSESSNTETNQDKLSTSKISIANEYYIVESNDTLYKISLQYGISVKELKEANGLATDKINIGQSLYIPQKDSTSTSTAINPSLQTEKLYIAEEVVNVHRTPSSNSERVTQALHGEPVRIISQRGAWVQVNLPDQFDYSGWVTLSTLKQIPVKQNWLNSQIVSIKKVEVRKAPSKDSPVIKVLPLGTVVVSESSKLSKKDGDFTSIKLVDGQQGYIISSALIDYSPNDTVQVSSEQIIATAKELLGQPYLWGGMTTEGVDCSGFVHTVFKVHGIRLHRDTDLQYAYDGVPVVTTKELQPGDLVFFETYKSGASHMGIYVGNRKFIHASSSQGVNYNSLDDSYYSKRYVGAKRILGSQS